MADWPAVRRACIDIGSNTTRLLVADIDAVGLRAVHEERVFTRIGAALTDAGEIPQATCEAVIGVVAAQLQSARTLGADVVSGVATAAIRGATNGAEFAHHVTSRTGLPLAVLSDAEEARLAFRGAAGTLEAPVAEPLGVLDVGGGSSEVVVGRAPGDIEWWSSLPIGSGSLARRHLAHDPPTADELAAARGEVDDAVAGLDPPRVGAAVAVGGSATTLGRLIGPRLDPGSLRNSLALLCAGPAAEVARSHGIDPDRARLLPAGLVILEVLGARLGTEVTVGRGGIREGVLLEGESR